MRSFMTQVIGLVPNLAGMSPGDALNALTDLVKNLAKEAFTEMVSQIDNSFVQMATALKDLIQAFDSSVDVPFIGWLYKWITGNQLSMLDLSCLVCGAAAHFVSVIVEGKKFQSLDGSGDVANFGHKTQPAAPMPAATTGVSNPLSWGGTDSRTTEIFYLVIRGLQSMYTVITDITFPEEAQSGKKDHFRSQSKCARGVCGIVADTMLLECANPGYYAKLVQEYNQEGKTPDGVAGLDWGTVVNIQVISGYAMSMVGNVITLGGGIAGTRGQSNSPAALSSPKIDFDAIEFGVTSFRDWVLVLTMVLTIYRLSSENQGSLEKTKSCSGRVTFVYPRRSCRRSCSPRRFSNM